VRIIIWGCRGSIATPGKNTLKYGGNTTCVEVRLDDGTVIVIDAGTGIRNLGKKLAADRRLGEIYLILTHSHWDHLSGFPFFQPAYLERFTIHVRGGPIAKESVKKYLEHQMEQPFFPARFRDMKAEFDFTHGIPMVKKIGSAEVIPIPLSHPNGGFGYKLVEKEKCFIFLTDNELDRRHESGISKNECIAFCAGADLLIHDAQYTEEEYKKSKGWGHSTWASAVGLAHRARVKRFGLFHHDPDHTDAFIDNLEAKYRDIMNSRNIMLNFFAVNEGREILI
jgi:phosphoribosyl 1,2-cyclic phosphodiesterase